MSEQVKTTRAVRITHGSCRIDSVDLIEREGMVLLHINCHTKRAEADTWIGNRLCLSAPDAAPTDPPTEIIPEGCEDTEAWISFASGARYTVFACWFRQELLLDPKAQVWVDAIGLARGDS